LSSDFLSSNGAETLAYNSASVPTLLPGVSPSRSSNFGAEIQELTGEKIG
jgi:hypothetical protein